MFPTFELFGKTISMYMICALIGIFAALFFTYRTAQRKKLDEIEMLYMMLWAFVGVLVFSHLLYAFTVPDTVAAVFKNLDKIKNFDDFLLAVNYVLGGSVFYGGLIGAIFAFFVYTKKKKLSFGDYSDIGGMAIPLFHIFGRLGCFFSGCCYGVECSFGITFHNSLVESANHVPRFPVQLVESGLNLALFLVLWYLYRRGKARHRILAVYLLVYPVYRFILEYFRADTYRGFVGVFSTSQAISILLFVTTLIWLLVLKVRKNKTK